ncbi:MAG: hypothetical protein IJT38_05590 [Clostridia bacterium]|nr:hypothetical protein [Clostridia bacterium]
MKYISLNDQLIKERQKNAALSAEARKNAADIDYIAMMCDVELESDEDNINAQIEED